MADNFLERHRQAYEERKAKWLQKQKSIPRQMPKLKYEKQP